jgi:hypothetical protein
MFASLSFMNDLSMYVWLSNCFFFFLNNLIKFMFLIIFDFVGTKTIKVSQKRARW